MSLEFQPKALVFDLESVPAQTDQATRLTMLGGLRPDTNETLERQIKSDPTAALHELDALAQGASFVLGHNIIEHDLPMLQQLAPELMLHQLPAIDTLRLSPLAFPQNPYHRLIKDYKLIRDSLNSPLSDCVSTLSLFHDQQQAFAHLHTLSPLELQCYQTLLAPERSSTLSSFFAALTKSFARPLAELKTLIPQLLQESDPTLQRDLTVCRSRLNTLLADELDNPELHWPLAYTLAWLRVSGGNSVLAPWVRHQFPETARLITELRDISCGQDDCQYCRTTHDPRHELTRYFGFPDFRYETPGQSLQHDIVLAGMRGENVLAILATGGGKSLCYQLPALNRFHRNGSLTVIVSPLQALMKDQVDGLLSHNIQCAATLNGMLTMPDRAEVLEKIQMGDVGILLVSPEQFRNKAFRRAIQQRQIGAWIFDEAHCLSKWGSDFRPDYLYISRFIAEYSAGQVIAPIGCFTATAKQEVLQDILQHFRDNLGLEFKLFNGGHERNNLNFDVLPCKKAEKKAFTHQLLQQYLQGESGGAVVFVASRKKAEVLAEFLVGQGWACGYFHAGIEPNAKADIHNDFKAGRLQVIVATSAFGMGVDKADIRLVVHADIPGSLENYLQEAGRAGRDQHNAHCVLLYDEQDVEAQFGMVERNKISLRDIQQILRKLRADNKRLKGDKLIITAGEILLDETVDTSFDAEDLNAETKVATALAWLERGHYLKRDENHTRIFPAKLELPAEQAHRRLKEAGLSQRREQEFAAILRFLYNVEADERVNTDHLMSLTGLTSDEVVSVLRQMEGMGILANDTQITLYLRRGIVGASTQRLHNSLQLEEALFTCLQEHAPEAENGAWQDLNVPALTAALKEATQMADLLPLHVLRLLRSLEQDKDPQQPQRKVFELRELNRDYLKLRINDGYRWPQIIRFGDKKRKLVAVLVQFLVGKLPDGLRGKDLLVETTSGELGEALEADLDLPHLIPPGERRQAIERGLLYLHRQEILTLNHGMALMRNAMSIAINPDKEGPFLRGDYRRLDEHYREKRIQVHVMREYAQVALKEMTGALQLVLDYFTLSKHAFNRRYFAGRTEVLKLATSEDSWRRIVDPLNEIQHSIVTDEKDANRLVLAGPGSGKTRVIVHRIAYLLRVRRVAATSIVALTFNRHAANEVRQRLYDLVGNDAYGVSVFTYHRMAMRLTGTHFARGDEVGEGRLKQVLEDAVELLEGKRNIEGEDELREQLLRGYRYILVDEYQDIDELQYRLVGALAGRQAEEEGKLCILAVGDDDQNIYAWRSTSNRYIQSFQQDYAASTCFLVDNYRSTRHIINAANQVIAANPERLKQAHAISVDPQRVLQPAGGQWQTLDAGRQGRVLRLQINTRDTDALRNLQAQAATAELQRLLQLEGGEWQGCAILARTHRYLEPVQAWCEQHQVPYFLAGEEGASWPLARQRTFVAAMEWLRQVHTPLSPAQVWQQLQEQPFLQQTSGQEFFATAFAQLQGEVGECQLESRIVVDWLYDYARELRQQPSTGLYLGTVHSAKGLEFRHVVLLDGGWRSEADNIADERRLYYVGMTRAEQSLTLCEHSGGNPFSQQLGDDVQLQLFQGAVQPQLQQRFQQLTHRDVDLGYAGRYSPEADIHQAIAKLNTGDPLVLREQGGRYQILDAQGAVVGQTARAYRPPFKFTHLEVAEITTRYLEESPETYRKLSKSPRWEVVVPKGRGAV